MLPIVIVHLQVVTKNQVGSGLFFAQVGKDAGIAILIVIIITIISIVLKN